MHSTIAVLMHHPQEDVSVSLADPNTEATSGRCPPMSHCNFISFSWFCPEKKDSKYLSLWLNGIHWKWNEELSQSFILDTTAQKYLRMLEAWIILPEDSLGVLMNMAVLMKCLIELNSVTTHLFTLLWKSSLDYRSDFISRRLVNWTSSKSSTWMGIC